jgi:exosortase
MNKTTADDPLSLSRRHFWFGLFVFISVFLFVGPVIKLWRLVQQDPEYSHVVVVLPISAALIFLNRNAIFRQTGSGSWLSILPGMAGAVAASIAVLMPTGESRLTMHILSLVLLWITAFTLLYGTQASLAALFPLSFLLLLVPVPEFLTAKLVGMLQSGSAATADTLFRIAGIPVLRSGVFFRFPNFEIEVARECSGIRSSLVLLVTGLVFSHSFLRKKWSKRVLVAAVLPLAIFKNGLRIFVLSALAMYVDRGFLDGPLHHRGGVVFYALTLGVFTLLLLLLRRLERFTPVVGGVGALPVSRAIVAGIQK